MKPLSVKTTEARRLIRLYETEPDGEAYLKAAAILDADEVKTLRNRRSRGRPSTNDDAALLDMADMMAAEGISRHAAAQRVANCIGGWSNSSTTRRLERKFKSRAPDIHRMAVVRRVARQMQTASVQVETARALAQVERRYATFSAAAGRKLTAVALEMESMSKYFAQLMERTQWSLTKIPANTVN